MSQLNVGKVVTGNASLATTGLQLPQFASNARPSSPALGQVIYNTTDNKAEIWNGSAWKEVGGGLPVQSSATRGAYLVSDGTDGAAFWAYPGAANPPSAPLTGFRYRSIITHGFLLGGYKGSQPWKSVNKTWHATDVTFYCGEQLDRALTYADATWSDYFGYGHGTVDSFTGNDSHTSSIGLHTGVQRQLGGGRYQPHTYGYDGDDPKNVMGYNTAGGYDMPVSRDLNACATAQVQLAGYNLGGGNATVGKLHFPTEVMYASGSSPSGSGHTAACGDENQSWASFSASRHYMNHSNDSWAAWSSNAAPDGVCKFLPSKYGHFYAGTGNNVTLPWTKYSGSSGVGLSSGNKVRAYGEENFEMGQDWGYMLGQYDGQQNNHTTKWNYTTDVETNLGAISRPKGHYGQSSGGCCSAAASMTSRTMQ